MNEPGTTAESDEELFDIELLEPRLEMTGTTSPCCVWDDGSGPKDEYPEP